MIVLRLMSLFIIPSGHEVKTSETDNPIIAFYYYYCCSHLASEASIILIKL